MFKEIMDKIEKANDQRTIMALTLMNVMKHRDTEFSIRCSVAASMISMLSENMLSEDKPLIKVLEDGINAVCEDAKQLGIDDMRTRLEDSIAHAKQIVEEKYNRINDGNDILNQINLN